MLIVDFLFLLDDADPDVLWDDMQLQQELKENENISDESLAVAISKVNNGKHRIEREIAKREQLQEALSQLKEQLVSEKNQLVQEHTEEVQALKKSWEDEKKMLLDVIQRDCNQVIEKRRKSPRTVSSDFSSLSPSSAAATSSPVFRSSPVKELNSEHKLESSSYSKIDEELRETEALVQSLLIGATAN